MGHLPFVNDQDVSPAELGKVVGDAAPDNATADDDGSELRVFHVHDIIQVRYF